MPPPAAREGLQAKGGQLTAGEGREQHRERVHLDADLQLDPLFAAIAVDEPP
jgi:hypothetical protein